MSRVYFIKPVGMDGPIKVGCSGSPETRRKALDTWSPFALEIIAEIEGGFDLERRFHALFKVWHERREWFSFAPEILATVAAINAGQFDISTLPAPEFVCANKKRARAAQLAAWTPERRTQASYFGRVRWTQLKTKTVCDHYASRVGEPAIRAKIDAYLADPVRHGEPLGEYIARTGRVPWWARNLPASDLRPTPTASQAA